MSTSSPVCRSMQSANAAATKLRPLSSSLLLSSLLSHPFQRSKIGLFDLQASSHTASPDQIRSFIVSALVQAGSCSHGRRLLEKRRRSSRREQSTIAIQRKVDEHGGQLARQPRQISLVRRNQYLEGNPYSRDDYRNLLDYYRSYNGSDYRNYAKPHPRTEQDFGPSLVGWVEEYGPNHESREMPEDELKENIESLSRLLTNDDSSPESIYDAYKLLPKPGVKYLDRAERIYLIRKLSVLRHKTPKRTLQYLSILDDYKAADLRIPRRAWNSALSLGGRTLRRVTDAEVEIALRTWKGMEQEAGTKSSVVTFNILFDIAAKAGKFALAEMILQEMRARGHQFSRFTRVGMIFYHGLRKDGDGVRSSYRDFVDSGEIVDTTVLNCVLGSLLTAGEPEAAEAVYKRMKVLSAEREGHAYAPRLWQKARELGRLLDWIVKMHKKDGRMLQQLQSAISIAPDTRTCNLLLHHYCKGGELHRAVSLLDEMQGLRIAPNTRTFTDLFHGFALHGGVRYSAWTEARLEHVLSSYLQLLEVEGVDLHVSQTLVIQAMAAFRKCSGTERQLRVWNSLKARWKPETDIPFENTVQKPEVDELPWDDQ